MRPSAFENARTRLEALLKIQPNNLELLTLAGANAFWLGQLSYDKSDYAATEPLFKKYHTYSETMYSLAPNDFNSIMELSYSHNSLGSLYLKQFNYTAAKQRFIESLTLKNEALNLIPNDKNLLIDRADTLSWIASTEVHLGNYSDALNTYEQAEKVLNTLTSLYPSDAKLFEMLAYTHTHQSYLLSYLPNKKQAYLHAAKATEAERKALKQDPKNKTFQKAYYRFLINQLLLDDKIADGELINKIVSFLNTQNKDDDISSAYINLIRYFIKNKYWRLAETYINQLSNEATYFEDKKVINGNKDVHITNLYIAQAKLALHKENKQALIDFCYKALKQVSNTAEKTNDIYVIFPLLQAYSCLNRLPEATEKVEILKEFGIANFDL